MKYQIKMNKILFTLTTFFIIIFSSNCSLAQSTSSNHFVQFIYTNFDTIEKKQEIDDLIRNKPGVIMERSDFKSKKFFLIYNPDLISSNDIEEWMNTLGMTYKCVRYGIHGIDKVLDLKTDCDQ
jgi:hypothetical protein